MTDRLKGVPVDLFLALDPLGLSLAQRACGQLRDGGLRPTLAYDQSLAPTHMSSEAQAGSADLRDVDLATAASTRLAVDGDWPPHLQGSVRVVYTSPLEFANPNALVWSLAEALHATDAPRVGLFLPPQRSREREKTVREVLKLLDPVRPIVFGGTRTALLRGRRGPRNTRRWASLGEADIARVVPQLDAVVCESVWTGCGSPSAAAVLAARERIGLVTSAQVADDFDEGFTADPASPRALADAISAAARTTRSRDDSTTDHQHAVTSRFAYGAQVAALRGHFGNAPRPKLGIGPRNGNGQAWAWAQALRNRRPALAVEVFAAEYPTGRLAMTHDVDVSIPLEDWRQRGWQSWWAHRLHTQFSHVLIEQGLTACGMLNGTRFFDDLPVMLRGGLRVGLVFRGSEIRNPAAHAARERWSPFADPQEPVTAQLQTRFEAERRSLAMFDVPVFVTTLDLLDDIPHATWLPQVLDTQMWCPGAPILQRARPVVLHAPSRTGLMKGSQWVDDACQPLHDAGVIEYRRLHGVPFSEMPSRIRDADIVIDQMALGSYGVLALQAMASERLVLGHVSARVRGRLSDPIPVLQAEPPDLRRVLEHALTDRAASQSLARLGRAYVDKHHSGQESADRLLEQLIEG